MFTPTSETFLGRCDPNMMNDSRETKITRTAGCIISQVLGTVGGVPRRMDPKSGNRLKSQTGTVAYRHVTGTPNSTVTHPRGPGDSPTAAAGKSVYTILYVVPPHTARVN